MEFNRVVVTDDTDRAMDIAVLVFAFLLVIGVLVLKPSGILGKPIMEMV